MPGVFGSRLMVSGFFFPAALRRVPEVLGLLGSPGDILGRGGPTSGMMPTQNISTKTTTRRQGVGKLPDNCVVPEGDKVFYL